jgi:hypothetical protein
VKIPFEADVTICLAKNGELLKELSVVRKVRRTICGPKQKKCVVKVLYLEKEFNAVKT